MIGLGAALTQAIQAEQRARAQVESTNNILGLLRRSLRAGIDAETGQRGFLLTEDESYLAPFTRAEQDWPNLVAELGRAIGPSATPAQKENVARMAVVADAKISELRRTIAMVRAGQSDAAATLVSSNLGQDLMQEFRALVRNLEDEEEAILRDALSNAARIERRTLPILGFLGLAILALVLVGFRLERRLAFAEFQARDTEALRRMQARSDLLAKELNHRVKNLFAVILSIISLSGRGKKDVRTTVADIRARVHALSLAHTVSQGNGDDAIVALADVLQATLGPYQDEACRIDMEGPSVDLPVKSVTPFGLVIHELATNAVKYGALSRPEGTVTLRWIVSTDADRMVTLDWTERGGPTPHAAAPEDVQIADGFGGLMMQTATQQLGGRMSRDLPPEGAEIRLAFPLYRD
ncbi:MAG: CHASE3 domain-containing protein [Pseudomonadota bacterium]